MTDLAGILRARYCEDAAAVRANWNRVADLRRRSTCKNLPSAVGADEP